MKKYLFTALLLLSALPLAFCALSADTTWEVRPASGNSNNGGGFVGSPFTSPPAAPGLSLTTGGTITNGTYYCVYTYVDPFAETAMSPESNITISDSTNDKIVLTTPIASNFAVNYKTYCGTVSGGSYFVQGSAVAVGTNSSITSTPASSGDQPSGIDYSQSATAQSSGTDLLVAAGANTSVSSATRAFISTDVGNLIRITGGTNWGVDFYEITAVSSNSATLDKAPAPVGTPSGNWYLGGATNSIDSQPTKTLADDLVGSQIVFIKNEAWNEAITTSVASVEFIGYNSTRLDNPQGADRPTLDRGGAAGDAFYTTANVQTLKNLIIQNAGDDCLSASLAYGDMMFYLVNTKIAGCGGLGFNVNSGRRNRLALLNSEITTCTTGAANVYQANNEGSYSVYYSSIHDNTGYGLAHGVTGAYFSLFYDNGGLGAITATSVSGASVVLGCTIDGNTGASTDGINLAAYSLLFNNIISNNGRYGLALTSTPVYWQFSKSWTDYNNVYGNAIDYYKSYPGEHDLSVDPQFTDAANDNYAIGTNLKAKGFSTYQAGGTSYLDIGALQRQESSSSGGEHSYASSS